MAFNVRTMLTARTPHAAWQAGAGPTLAGGLPKVGSVLTALSGIVGGAGSLNPAAQWYSGASSIANATNFSYSVQSAGNYHLSCRMSFGNATWGTFWKEVSTGTVIA